MEPYKTLEENSDINKDISIIVPVYNEASNLEILCNEIISVIQPLGLTYEIIFVDSKSQDGSYGTLRNLKEKIKYLVIIKLKKRFGQSAALSLGMHFAKGSIVIAMDSDLQNNPQDIPRFIEKIKDNYDIVCGWREKRKDSYLRRVFPSRVGNEILSRLSGVKIHDFSCTFKAFRAHTAKKIAKSLHKGFHRFIPLLAKNMNLNICEIKIEDRPRIYGRSKYGFSKFIHAFEGVFILHFIYLSKRGKASYFVFLTLCILVSLLLLFAKFILFGGILMLFCFFLFYVAKKGRDLLLLKETKNLQMIEEIIN